MRDDLRLLGSSPSKGYAKGQGKRQYLPRLCYSQENGQTREAIIGRKPLQLQGLQDQRWLKQHLQDCDYFFSTRKAGIRSLSTGSAA